MQTAIFIARKDSVRRFVTLLLLAAAPLGAQVRETPVPFDSAGRVRTLTPALVARFDLRPPAWPVAGEFTEARLLRSSDSTHVLSVERQDRTVERYSLTPDNVAALRFAIDAAMARSGQTVSEDGHDALSQPARGAFVRNQMLLTWLVYGPSLAAISQDAKAGTALYLLATGASYFVTTGISRKMVVTRAQNHLSSDGAFRGWGVAAGLTRAFAGGDADSRTYAISGLAGSLGGAVIGFQRGARLTDSEAQASASVSNLGAGLALGLLGTSGLADEDDEGRAVSAAMVAGGLLGYAVGPEYPRRARYTVTRGDIQVTEVGSILGAAIGLTPFVRDNADNSVELLFGIATAGMLGGTYIAERAWARKYNHSSWDAGQTRLGALAGILMGSAVTVLAEPGVQGGYSLVVGGATLGAILGHNLAKPERAGSVQTGDARTGNRRFSLETNPQGLMLGAMGVPGRHSLLRVTF